MNLTGSKPDVLTYTHLIAMCGRAQDGTGAKQAADLLAAMRAGSLAVPVATYATMLATCARSNDVSRAREAWASMLGEGLAPSVPACGALVDCLARAGMGEEAQSIIREYPTGDTLVTRTSVVSGLARAGKVDDAVDALDQMITAGFRPNARAYTAVIHALGKEKRSTEALDILERALTASVDLDSLLFESAICACGASGDVDSAFAVLRAMRGERLELSDRGYEGLIYACGSIGNVERAYVVYVAACEAGAVTPRVLSAVSSAFLRMSVSDARAADVLNRMELVTVSNQHHKLRSLGVNPDKFQRKLESLRRVVRRSEKTKRSTTSS
jgi:pentatricopeptide repeat protein